MKARAQLRGHPSNELGVPNIVILVSSQALIMAEQAASCQETSLAGEYSIVSFTHRARIILLVQI